MEKLIKINIKEFYQDAVGIDGEIFVCPEVYDLLVKTFRREEEKQRKSDRRHIDMEGYCEGCTENALFSETESLENIVLHNLELNMLQKAMQTLTEIQRERLHLYFFKDMTTREIAQKEGVSQQVVNRSIQSAIKKLKKYFI